MEIKSRVSGEHYLREFEAKIFLGTLKTKPNNKFSYQPNIFQQGDCVIVIFLIV